MSERSYLRQQEYRPLEPPQSSIPWARFAQQQRRPSDESWDKIKATRRSNDSQGEIISALLDRVEAMEAAVQEKDKKLLDVFESFSTQIIQEQEEIRRLTKELGDLSKFVYDMDPVRTLSDRELFLLSRKVHDQINWSNFMTKQEAEDLRKTSTLQSGLIDKVNAVEKELIDPAGMMSTITTRVAALEASKSATSIELAGYVFRDEASVEAFAKAFCDPAINRFVVDPVSLLLLSEPKYETVEKGLLQLANALKANFLTLDRATIDLSYQMVYPDRMLTVSNKDDALINDGVQWAPPFKSHEVFEGAFGSGTKFRLQRAIDTVVNTMQAGIDYHFPPLTHPKANAIFSKQLRLSHDQVKGLLDCLTPLYKKISMEGSLAPKEAWSRVMVFVKSVFDDIYLVRAPNSEASTGSMMWGSFRTTQFLKSYQDLGWANNPKVAIALTFASMKKEGSALGDLTTRVGSLESTAGNHARDIRGLTTKFNDLKSKNPSLSF
jgi:hypothetical protein